MNHTLDTSSPVIMDRNGHNALLANHIAHTASAAADGALHEFAESLNRYPLPVLHPSASLTLSGGDTAAASTAVTKFFGLSALSEEHPEGSSQVEQSHTLLSFTSPFRFASSAAYHASIARTGGASTLVMRLCHEFPVTDNRTGAQSCKRKRTRLAMEESRAFSTSFNLSQPPSQYVPASVRTTTIPVTARQLPFNIVETATQLDALQCSCVEGNDPLMSRVLETEDMLNEIIGCSSLDRDVVSQVATGVEKKQSSVAAQAQQQFSFSASDASSMTVKELKSMCAALGLLTSGIKEALLKRLITAQQQPVVFPPQSSHARSDEGSNSTHNMMAAAAPQLQSSSTPRRTVFRYTSASRSPVRETSSVMSTPTPPPPPSQSMVVTRTGKRVGPPDLFALDFVARYKATTGMRDIASPSQCPVTQSSCPGSMRGGGANEFILEDGNTGSSNSGVQWTLLVDSREKIHGKHEKMLALLERQKIPCRSQMLPCGDYMLSVMLPGIGANTIAPEGNEISRSSSIDIEGEAEALLFNNPASLMRIDTAAGRSTVSRPAMASTTRGIERSAHMQQQMPSCGMGSAAHTTEPGEFLFSLVVERKTAADLEASIKGSRYTEQSRLLATSPFSLIVWLVEGEATASFHRTAKQSTPLVSSSSSSQSSSVSRIDSACASLARQHRFCVVRTRNVQESVSFLKHLTQRLVGQLMSQIGDGRQLCWNTDGGSADLCVFRPLAVSFKSSSSSNGGHTGLFFAPMQACLAYMSSLQQQLRASTAFPRMLMCVRGCSASLALALAAKYGSMYRFWKALESLGREACDADEDIRKLTVPQKKTVVLLTEFLLAREYF